MKRFAAVLIMVVGAPSPALAQQLAQDFYLHRGDAVAVTIHLDSVGVARTSDVSRAVLDSALATRSLRFARELPDGVLVYSLAQALLRDSIFNLGRELSTLQGAGVQIAGPLARLDQGEDVFFLNHQIVVRFREDVTDAQIQAVTTAHGLRVVRRNPFEPWRALVELIPASARDVLATTRSLLSSPFVESAYPNFGAGIVPTRHTPNDPLFPLQWHLNNGGMDIGATQAWDITLGRPDVVTAILEINAFDVLHPDLNGNLWKNPGEVEGDGIDNDSNGYIDDIIGWNFSTQTGDLSAGVNRHHGTAVAGLAAAIGDNAEGGTGVCPRCSLMLIRMGSMLDGFVDAFVYARHQGARVINASWAYPRKSELEFILAETASWGAAGIPIVMSMRNFPETDKCATPLNDVVAVADVIGVGASNMSDQRIASSFGACIDLLAPGGGAGDDAGITTTDTRTIAGYNHQQPMPACTFTELADLAYTRCFAGTSAAAPIVSGIIGLMLSCDDTLTRAEVQQLLRETAEPIEPLVAGYDANGFSLKYGYGRANAAAALERVKSACAEDVIPLEDPEQPPVTTPGSFEAGARAGIAVLSNGGSRTVVSAPGGGPLALPAFHVAWFFAPHLAAEVQLGLRYDSGTTSAAQESEIAFALQPSWYFSTGAGSLYVGPNAALHMREISGSWSTEMGWGGAVGFRWKPLNHLALRLESGYRYWSGPSLHEIALALAAGIVF